MNPIIQSLFNSFTQVFESNNNQHTLETFCKIISVHQETLGFFVRYHDPELLSNWFNIIKNDSNLNAFKINDQSFEIEIIKNNECALTLFELIKSWQTRFDHTNYTKQPNDDLEIHFNDAYSWIHSWMSKHLSTYLNTDINTPFTLSYTLPKLKNNQIIHAMGLQQNIKLPLTQWQSQDATWWQNIPQSALVLSFLSHNIGNEQLPLKIKFELLTSQTQLNPKIKLEQLFNNQNRLTQNISQQMQTVFLIFELNCLNACTFFRPYKLLYAIIELERSIQKLNALPHY